jgi:translation initiation factor 2B subunit (eIF-2B alpha/beta/delta family)
VPEWLERVSAIASDRTRGASFLLADLLPALDGAIAAGRDATIEAARRVCAGQPAMAPLWNACAAAVAEFSQPGRYARRRAEFVRAQGALVRVTRSALTEAIGDAGDAQLITVSYSGSVAAALVALAPRAPSLHVICAESLPGGEGEQLFQYLTTSGVAAELVHDATLSRYLSSSQGVIVGADAVSAESWTNKVGTYALSTAAWFSQIPVYVVASRDKAACAELSQRLFAGTPLFENTPAHLASMFLTDTGAIPAGDLSGFTERFRDDVRCLLEIL